MMLVGALTMPEAATSAYLMTTDRQWLRVGLAASAWIITLTAAALLVPEFGFVGAIAAHAISRSIIFSASIVIVARTSSINLPYVDFARALAAGAVGTALAAGVLLVSSNLAAQFVAGAVYGLGCIGGSVLFGVWTTRDVGLFAQIAAKLPWLSRLFDGLKRRVRDA
jgi:O-antigen/teichoic acid export membrane protein